MVDRRGHLEVRCDRKAIWLSSAVRVTPRARCIPSFRGFEVIADDVDNSDQWGARAWWMSLDRAAEQGIRRYGAVSGPGCGLRRRPLSPTVVCRGLKAGVHRREGSGRRMERSRGIRRTVVSQIRCGCTPGHRKPVGVGTSIVCHMVLSRTLSRGSRPPAPSPPTCPIVHEE